MKPTFEVSFCGAVQVDYGGSLGSERFPDLRTAVEHCAKWVDKRLSDLEREKADTARFLADLCIAFEQDKVLRALPPKK